MCRISPESRKIPYLDKFKLPFGLESCYMNLHYVFICYTNSYLLYTMMVYIQNVRFSHGSKTKRKKYALDKSPKYQTAYACEGKKLAIKCEPGDLISLIRANYGRFSITICNDHGNMEWSVNCMFPKSLTVLNSRCANKQSCSVLATTSMFGDPCPGTHKYLEAHYQCVSSLQTSTTSNRPSPPPWVLSNNPPQLSNGSSLIPAMLPPSMQPAVPPRFPLPSNGINNGVIASGTHFSAEILNQMSSSKSNYNTTAIKMPIRHDIPPPLSPPTHHLHHTTGHHLLTAEIDSEANNNNRENKKSTTILTNTTLSPNVRILDGVGVNGNEGSTMLTMKTVIRGQPEHLDSLLPSGSDMGTPTLTASVTGGIAFNVTSLDANLNESIGAAHNGYGGSHIMNISVNTALDGDEDSNLFCPSTNARNLFWNLTKVGDINVQPCPGGATGIAKWRCVLIKRMALMDDNDDATDTNKKSLVCNSTGCESLKVSTKSRYFEPYWHPLTPDLTQCRSLWLNNLEVRVNQRDSSLISIANDLSEVTSSKTLYGGDMLVTTKIIQIMSEKMLHDKETFPDQRLREAMILELLQGVVKTGSNLLDESQLSSWLDLNQEDQMRVATSLLTGLEDNAFLLADTIIRERNVVQKVKNILLSIRVLETKNIQNNEIFPDDEQWHISDDRIELPRLALMENSEGGLVRIVFAAFDRLESILRPTYDHFDLKNSRAYAHSTVGVGNGTDETHHLQQRLRILNSKVISASLGKGRHIQLSQPIKLVLRHLKTENVTNPICVFWNYIDHTWSANGCILESSNRTHSICMCNHLTNFAILMDIMNENSKSLFTMFDGNMRILIYISISICILFIVIALLTLKIFNGVFIKSIRTTIYRSIYVCLLLIELLFLIGIELRERSIFCGFTTVFLHCTVLASIAWFCFEAFQSYTTLNTEDILLDVDQTSRVNCYYLMSYGLSFSIVAISLAINPNTYTRNDFCVLMESNAIFYGSFMVPAMLFILSAFGYTFMSWVIMCRKTRTTLKNKEHALLANVRFDIRCSFTFMLMFCTVWLLAYFYLRRSKSNDSKAEIYGYLFICFNTLMGIYIFIFHCIQNEKIRGEYRKYVRQNAWLPKCLRCSKASISSGVVGGGSAASACAINNAGALNPTNLNALNETAGNTLPHLSKNKLTNAFDIREHVGSSNITLANKEEVIMADHNCEMNDLKTVRRVIPPIKNMTNNGKGGTMVENLILVSDTIEQTQNHFMEQTNNVKDYCRNGVSGNGAGVGVNSAMMIQSNDNLRSTGDIRTSSGGHTSPTSSINSSHLMFANSVNNQETYYHQPNYGYSGKVVQNSCGKTLESGDYHGVEISEKQTPHEFFYWTQKHAQKKMKRGGSVTCSDSPSGSSLHSRNTNSSQIMFYPSYKKTSIKQQQRHQPCHHYTEAADISINKQQFWLHSHHHHPQQYLQHQQQLSSDEEQIESATAHATLLQQMNRRGGGKELPLSSTHIASSRYYNRNKSSNCDLTQPISQTQNFDGNHGNLGNKIDSDVGEMYYNQSSLSGDNGPVYEEILSTRTSGIEHYNVDDMLPSDGNYEKEHNEHSMVSMSYQQHPRVRYKYHGMFANNTSSQYPQNTYRYDYEVQNDCDSTSYSEDDDNDVNINVNQINENVNHFVRLHHNGERKRRIKPLEGDDYQQRLQQCVRKNVLNQDNMVETPMYNDYSDSHYRNQKIIQQQPQMPHENTHLSSSSGIICSDRNSGALSIRSYKKTPSISGSRLAINELFNHGNGSNSSTDGSNVGNENLINCKGDGRMAMPSTNQHPNIKKNQQLLPPQNNSLNSIANNITPIGRNISAMLDENNTVRCYLEPLEK